MASRRRKVLTLEQRVKVIELSEKGESARRIAKKLEVGKTQIQSILLAKEEIMQELKDGASCTRKYRQPRHMLYKDIDAAVWEWFCIARGKGMSVSDPLLQQKAMMFSASLGHDEFTASNGWLQSFKRRHNIRAAALSGESGDIKDMTDWLKRVPALIQMGRYSPGDVFGVDETGLFFRALPSKMAWTGERCHDGEKSEERFTVLLACSATGEKLPPLIVGKSKAPQSFQNNLANVGISYRQNNRAWMTKVLFLEWLELVNKRMRTQNRKVLMILNKCAAHPDVELSNVELFFLPKNTMSCLQPLDTRIIQAVKLQYRKFLLHWAANASDECSSFSELAKDVSLFEAIAWLRSAWDSLKDSTIKQCFDHCGISFSDSSADEDDADVNDIAPELEALLDGVTLREFADMDNDLCTSYEDNHDDWEQRIVQRVKDGYPAVQDKDSDEEEAADSLSAAEAVPEVISSGEANKMVQQFEHFPVASDCNELLETLTKAQDLIQHKKFNEINFFHPKEMSEEQREALGEAHAQPMVVGGYQVYHSNADGDESSMNGEEDSEQSDPLGAVRVKFEPIDTEYDVEDEDENTMDELSSAPSTSRMPPRLHSQNVADLLHEGSSSMQTQIREMLSNKSVDSNTAAANVQNVIEALLKKNEDLLAQNDALGFKPNPRRGRVPGELGKHSQVVFPQVPGQFATFSAGGNTQGKISLSGSRSKAQQESASSVPMGRIVRPRSPTRRCSIPEKDKSHFSLALMESKVGDEDSEEIFQVQEHEMVCAVASKTKFLNIKDQVVASFDINFYWCNFCTFSTPNKALLLQHVMDHRFNCKYCRYQSFCRSDVVQHSVHTHPDFQEVAAVTQYCTLLSDYLRVKNPKLARLDSRHKRKRRRSPDRCDDSDQDSGQPPKLSRQYAPAGGRNAANPPPLRSANYNYYDVTIDMDESNEDRSSTPGPESQGKGGGSTSASASSSSSAVVTGSDSSHAAPPPNLRPQLAPSTQMAGQPVITQVFSAANFPHAPRVPSPLTPELPLSGNQRRSGAGSNSSSRSGSARASPSPSPAAAHSGGERASPQIRSNLYWSCGYCSFTSKSQSEIKDHSVRQHSGKPHRYVALIKPDGRSGGGDTGGSNSSTSVSNQGNEKDADGDSAAGNAAEGDEQGQPGGSSDTTGEPSQASQLPVTVSVKQEPEDSDEEIVPIKVRFPPARIQSKDTSSLRCFHCKYSSRLLGPLRNHILYNHKGSCLIGLGPMNCKVFMCPRADCTFRSSSGLTFLNHSRDCTPWSKPEARDVRVEPHLMTCLEETIQMAKETQGGSHQQPKVSTTNDFSCTYCSFSSPTLEQAKHHVLNRHGNRQLVVRNVRALRQRKRSFIFFCRSCPWESAKTDDNHVHLQCCTQSNDDPACTSDVDGDEGDLLSNNNVKTKAGGDQVFLDVDLHDQVDENLFDDSAVNVRDPLDDHNYPLEENLHAASGSQSRKVAAHKFLSQKNVAQSQASIGSGSAKQNRTASVISKNAKLKRKQPFLGFSNRRFKQTLPTGSTGIFDYKRLGEVQCMSCARSCPSLDMLREHHRVKHPQVCAFPFRSLRRRKQHLKCIFYACPGSKCTFFRWSELDVVDHYRQNHSSIPHPYLDPSYSPSPGKQSLKRFPKSRLSLGDAAPRKDQPQKKVQPAKTLIADEPCYQCLYCPGYYYSDTVQEMKDHYLNAHPGQDIVMRDVDAHKDKKASRVYICDQPFCDFSTLRPEELMVHTDSGHMQEVRLRTYQCTSCGWITNNDSSIEEHVSGVHGQEGGAAVVEIGHDERGSTVVERGSEERRLSAEKVPDAKDNAEDSS